MYKHIVSILIVLVYNVLFCLGQSAKTREPRIQDIKVLAWNEDTINSYQLAITKDKSFFYTITNRDGTRRSEVYAHGSINYLADTIHLTYKNRLPPAGLKNFLLIETSGAYLIQPLTNGKRIYLRFQRKGHLLWNNIPVRTSKSRRLGANHFKAKNLINEQRSRTTSISYPA